MEDELTGYLHNISPLKKGSKTTWFDMQIQTEAEVVRGVCFSAAKHNDFKKYSEQKSPIKIKKFNIDSTGDTKSVLMSPRIQVEPLPELNFEPITIPTTVSIPSITSVNPGQLVDVKANLLYLSGEKKANTMNGPKSKVEATLRDPFGSIRITHWEQYTNQVQEGKTYAFKNLKVRKNGDWHELTTARDGSTTITEVEPFKETLDTPTDIPESFLISKSTAEILGIAQFSVYHSCQVCKKKLHHENTNILKCGNCGLKQKLAKCSKNIYLQVVVKIDDNTNLTLFDQTIKNLLIAIGKKDMPQTEDNIAEVFLDLPLVEITYNKKTKIVTDVVPKA